MAPSLACSDKSGYAAFLLEERILENKFNNGVMRVNGREFLMGDLHKWPKATADFRVSFMVRSSIWLRTFLDRDPVLKHQDFVIRRTRDSSFTGDRYLASQMKLSPDLPLDCRHCYYNLTLDPILQVKGYDVYSNALNSLYFLPKNSAISHGFKCTFTTDGREIGDLSLCSVIVVYPYATNIVLNGRRMLPGTVAEYGPNFAAIAERMLEVVTCIDITDRPSLKDPADPIGLLESHPNLTECRTDLAG